MIDDQKREDLTDLKCDCGWKGTPFDMIRVVTPEGLWDKCPDCGNVSDDMEEPNPDES